MISDCAFNKKGECTVLKETKCNKCSFRKTQKQLDEGRKRAKRRINALPTVERESIKKKYHPLEKISKGYYE